MIDGSDYGAPVPISGGKASITLNSLAPGRHPFSAVYNSNSLDFTGSSSPLQEASVGEPGEGPYQFASGPAIDVPLNNPSGVAVDRQGDVFIADSGDNAVFEMTGDTITIVAGTGTVGYSGDGGSPTAADLNDPTAVAVDGNGDLFIADAGNNVIREVKPGPNGSLLLGTISTVAGGGSNSGPTFSGPATEVELNDPSGLAVDAQGDLFIAEAGNNVVREVTNGIITTIAGDGTAGYSGDGQAAATPN